MGEQSWGFRSNEDFFSKRYLTTSIDKIMALGGSYLLNVGPDKKGDITEEYASRIRKVGDWYKRMEGCLVCHEADEFNYKIKKNKAIVTQKDGKSYFHFYDGTMSSAVAFEYFPKKPQRVRLMNTGKELNCAIEKLPEYAVNGQAVLHLHITGIPIDDLSDEPIVIEVTW